MSLLVFPFFLLLIVVNSDFEEPPHYKYSREANIKEPLQSYARSESPQRLWMECLGAVFIISLAPFVILFLIPDLNKHRYLLKILLAFAAGGLLGDAFLHLIPHALDVDHEHKHGHVHEHINEDEHGHTHKHSLTKEDSHAHTSAHEHTGENIHDHKRHLIVGLCVVAGIFVFFCIDKFIRIARHANLGSHQHSHSQTNSIEFQNKSKNKKKSNGDNGNIKKENKPVKSKPVQELKVAGYLNLAADFTHNFTDGLAIGGSFLISQNVGIVTTLTVLLHELPHEIGDYAILIQSGFSSRKALLLQLLTALGAFMGASLSLIVAGIGLDAVKTDGILLPNLTKEMVTSCILPFTAGGFIYIAMTSVLADLLSSDETSSSKSSGFFGAFMKSICEVGALIFGVGMMALLGSME